MTMRYRWIKDQTGTLDPEFVSPLAKALGLRSFVETGTYLGDTVASMEPLFVALVSIELSPQLAERARARFAGSSHISILEGDSVSQLPEAMRRVGEAPALVWLDAHYSGGNTARGSSNTPIIAELEHLLAERGGRDVILIDDVRNFWPSPAEGFLRHEATGGYPMLNAVTDMLQARAGYATIVFGDALLAVPPDLAGRLPASRVLQACTTSRLLPPREPLPADVAAVIVGSDGAERAALASLPAPMLHQIEYGLGGHYFLWRGMIRHAEGDRSGARTDFEVAERCGLAVPAKYAEDA